MREEGFGGAATASQTLVRGLDVLEMVATGPIALPALANRLGLARSTAHRLATALLERRYLTVVPREGYGLGPKLLELGACAREQTALVRIARPYMQSLAAESLDTVYLSMNDAGLALVLERIRGHRRILPSLRVGEREKLTRGAAGFALLMDESEAAWRHAFAQDCGTDCRDAANTAEAANALVARMRGFADIGYCFTDADTVDHLRTVAAPVRTADGAILAALCLSTAAQYLDDARLTRTGEAVRQAAAEISADLGWQPRQAPDLHTSAHANTPIAERTGSKPRANDTIAMPRARHPLEAKAPHVHDPKLNGVGHADKQDLGVNHEA